MICRDEVQLGGLVYTCAERNPLSRRKAERAFPEYRTTKKKTKKTSIDDALFLKEKGRIKSAVDH